MDVAVAGRLDEDPLPSLRTELVTRYPFVLICRNDHELAEATRLSLKTIARHPFVIPGAGTNARIRFDEVFTAADLRQQLQVVMEANTKELLLSYVQMGFGIAVASMSPMAIKRFAAEGGRSPLVFHDLSRLFGHENINLFVRKSRYQPPHERAFCDMLLEACRGR